MEKTKETNDTYNTKRIYASLAYIYGDLGQSKKSLFYLERNLFLDRSNYISTQRWETIEALTKVLLNQRLFQSSILFQKEALDIAITTQNRVNEHLSLLYLGEIYINTKEFVESRNYFAKSLELAKYFDDENAKNKALALSRLNFAELEKFEGRYEESNGFYKLASEFYQNNEFKAHLYTSHKGLLLNHLLTKNSDEFQKELPKILEIFKGYRQEIIEEQNRNSFFDNEQDVYDIATEYEFEKANFAKAYDYTEESRSRSLLDLQNSVGQVSDTEKTPEVKFSANLSEPLKLSQIQTEIPENTQLLVYSVLPEKVLIWSITKDNLATAKSEISSDNLQEKVTNYLELVSKNQELSEQIKLTKELYQTLITPIKDKLDSQKQIVIIPDKFLFRLPFATLYSDKYFIEDYKISYSPSANVFLNCTKKGKEFNSESAENLLSIGNPTFNQIDYKNLQSLPSAKVEANEIAKLYTNPKVLVENEATKEQVKENLKNADVFHFAGHYIVEEKTPFLSSLVLAGDKESNLANYEIISEKFLNTRLIVLSACNTGIEKYYKGEGMIGASRTFLALNVPIVVASQWKVDSESTKELMIRFHQLRKTEKLSTAEALRKSQIEIMKNEKFNQPYFWAAFATLGGYTQF
ncbi:MAG: CHAT domain-containing protein [Flavobacterium sp.]|nr:CHAT domain-containing protein [Pyrinomonadaceae bacterium]MCU0350409.1 CHAT domain-containing protein [Flavobacterium sp.]